MDEQHFSPDDELDLSGEGLQTQRADLRIIETDVTANDNGQRWVVVMEPVGEEIEGLMGNKVRDSGYLSHRDRPDLVKIGRSSLKRLGKHACGTEVFKLNDLIGCTVNAQISEDDSGFARVRQIRASAVE